MFGAITYIIHEIYVIYMPIPVVARSKVWVCDRYPAGIVGWNPAGGMDVCFL